MSILGSLIGPATQLLDKVIEDKDQKNALAHEIATLYRLGVCAGSFIQYDSFKHTWHLGRGARNRHYASRPRYDGNVGSRRYEILRKGARRKSGEINVRSID